MYVIPFLSGMKPYGHVVHILMTMNVNLPQVFCFSPINIFHEVITYKWWQLGSMAIGDLSFQPTWCYRKIFNITQVRTILRYGSNCSKILITPDTHWQLLSICRYRNKYPSPTQSNNFGCRSVLLTILHYIVTTGNKMNSTIALPGSDVIKYFSLGILL